MELLISSLSTFTCLQMVTLREEMTLLQTLVLNKRLKGKKEEKEGDVKTPSPLAAIIMAMAQKNKTE